MNTILNRLQPFEQAASVTNLSSFDAFYNLKKELEPVFEFGTIDFVFNGQLLETG